MRYRIARTGLVAVAALLLGSCGYGGGSSHGLWLSITDAPIDAASNVVVDITGFVISGENGTFQFPLGNGVQVDLHNLQGGISALVNSAPMQLPAGTYHSVGMVISANANFFDSYIVLPDGTHSMYIPLTSPNLITIPIDFTIQDGQDLNLTIEFDTRQSIFPDPNNPSLYILDPKLRIVRDDDVGTITGNVASTFVPGGCAPAVYVFSGSDITPTDININSTTGTLQPLTSTLVGLNGTTGEYDFTVGFLPPGSYTLAYTCQAGKDDPTQTDYIKFNPVITTTVHKNKITFVSLD